MTLRSLIALSLVMIAPAAFAAEEPVYVLAVGNAESFDRDLPTLRYAHDDLARFTRVLERTGMAPVGNVVVVKEGNGAAVRAAFADMAKRVKRDGGMHARFIFFYTGHSDATGLHLADGLLRKSDIHELIAKVPAEARIAFFDGCYSGALAAKGVKPSGDFIVPKAEVDQPTGSVFLAATSGTDVAFEVEELQGSLFAHHVVDGLYGAADGNKDGLVTIDELYQHVYKQMEAYASALPAARAQKPEYRVDLQGRGALVLSYLSRTTVPVEIDATVAGDLTLASTDGLQVFRVSKRDRMPLKMLLVPGDYDVTMRDGTEVGRGTLRVRGPTRLARADLSVRREQNLDLVAKGKRPETRFGVGVGTAVSSFERIGPSAEVMVATPSLRIESSDWRFVGNLAARRSTLLYRKQTGVGQTVGLLFGAGGSFTRWCAEGQQWRLLIGGGADYTWQRWDERSSQAARTFEHLMPKAAVGLGTAFTMASGLTWGLTFRREFPFAKESGTGDVLAFGASVVAASLEW